jgi:hypothetical protein
MQKSARLYFGEAVPVLVILCHTPKEIISLLQFALLSEYTKYYGQLKAKTHNGSLLLG